jgi:triacylglycerol lipase
MNEPGDKTRAGADFDLSRLDSPESMTFAAHLSALAYQPEDRIRAQIAQFGGTPENVHFMRGTNLFGFVAKFSGFAFVVFRGTQTRGDWKDNLDIRTIPTFCGDVHYGFARCLDSLSALAIHEIETSLDKSCKICLTGHSKGGALAVLATAVLRRNGYDPLALYTFGQPKVGGKTFVKWWEQNVNTNYYRVVNGSDIVPHLPPGLEDIPSLVVASVSVILYLICLPCRLLANLASSKSGIWR